MERRFVYQYDKHIAHDAMIKNCDYITDLLDGNILNEEMVSKCCINLSSGICITCEWQEDIEDNIKTIMVDCLDFGTKAELVMIYHADPFRNIFSLDDGIRRRDLLEYKELKLYVGFVLPTGKIVSFPLTVEKTKEILQA